jgi:membrane glycosyltransferase
VYCDFCHDRIWCAGNLQAYDISGARNIFIFLRRFLLTVGEKLDILGPV